MYAYVCAFQKGVSRSIPHETATGLVVMNSLLGSECHRVWAGNVHKIMFSRLLKV